MANLSTIRQVIEQHLNDNWDTNVADIMWDAVDLPIPEDGEWIRPIIDFDNAENAVVGTSRTRHHGVVIIQVFTKLHGGSGKAYDVASSLISLYQNKRLHSDIFSLAGTVERVGDEGNGWFQLNVVVPFMADQKASD